MGQETSTAIRLCLRITGLNGARPNLSTCDSAKQTLVTLIRFIKTKKLSLSVQY